MYNSLRIFFFFVICGPIGLPQVFAQFAEDEFTRYSVRNGLCDNTIVCLEQDDQGYLWIGTDAGLNRFDGNSFKSYYRGTPPLHLPSSGIWRLKKMSAHQLGIITRSGVELLHTGNYSARKFIIPDSSAFSPYLNSAWDVMELKDKSYAVTTASGFYVFNPEGKLTMRHDVYSINDLLKERILYGRDIFQVSEQTFMVYVEEQRMAVYNDQNKSFRELDRSGTEWDFFSHPLQDGDDHWVVKHQMSPQEFLFIPNHNDIIIYYDHSAKKKVASRLPFEVHQVMNWESKISMLNDTSFVINDKTNGFYLFTINKRTGSIKTTGDKFLPNYKIVCLFADKDERLWVGTTEGLLKQNIEPPVIRAYRYPPPSGGKYTGGFTCAFIHKNILYAGRFSNNSGLAIIDAGNMQLIRNVSFFSDTSPWNELRSIEMYHPDTLWIGSNGGLLWFATQTGNYGKVWDEKEHPWSTDFYPHLAPVRKDGYAWMCAVLGGKVAKYHIPTRTFTVYTAETDPALPFSKVKSIAYDAYGDVWIGGHSLARFNNQKQEFDTLITVYGGVNKYNDNILTLTADENGSLWMHNTYNGILEYKIREKKFVAYTMEDGLPSDVFAGLSPVIDNALWISGNNQLTLFNTENKKITVYNYDDGLPEIRPSSRRMYFDAGTNMLFMGSDDYIVTFPVAPEKRADLSSGLILQELIVNNNKTYYTHNNELDINYNENNLTLNFTVIDFENSNYQFAYRLNHTGHWNVLGNQRSINLSNLAPGTYSVQLKAYGKPGIEKTNKLFFVIHSPVWKTAWFITLAAVLFTAGVYFFFRYRIRNIRQRANLDKMLVQTEIKALQAQMNPHFIFNSLNSIGQMILNNENNEASRYLSKFARLIRITLDQSSQSMVSLRNTIDYLQRYMEMENIRNSYFTHKITVDPSLDQDDTFVPPMLIQPFIENAIWHGVTATQKCIHVNIDFKKKDDNLVCRIEDNGIGIRQANHQKSENGRHQPVGIANIQNRVALLNEKYNLHGQISILDKKDIPGCCDTGTVVTLELPLNLEEA